MAIAKRSRRGQDSPPPDAAAFVRLLDENLATPEAVSAAYQMAVRDWADAAGPVTAEVVVDRPSPEPPSDGAALIALQRRLMFDCAELGRKS